MARTCARTAAAAIAIGLAAAGTYGCVAAAAAGAGAATAAYVTTRGAKAVVDRPVDQASSDAQAVLKERNVSISGQNTEHSGARREFKGTTQSGEEVTVTLNQDGKNARLTEVEVNVKKNAVQWNQSLAKQIADEIVSRSGKG